MISPFTRYYYHPSSWGASGSPPAKSKTPTSELPSQKLVHSGKSKDLTTLTCLGGLVLQPKETLVQTLPCGSQFSGALQRLEERVDSTHLCVVENSTILKMKRQEKFKIVDPLGHFPDISRKQAVNATTRYSTSIYPRLQAPNYLRLGEFTKRDWRVVPGRNGHFVVGIESVGVCCVYGQVITTRPKVLTCHSQGYMQTDYRAVENILVLPTEFSNTDARITDMGAST